MLDPSTEMLSWHGGWTGSGLDPDDIDWPDQPFEGEKWRQAAEYFGFRRERCRWTQRPLSAALCVRSEMPERFRCIAEMQRRDEYRFRPAPPKNTP